VATAVALAALASPALARAAPPSAEALQRSTQLVSTGAPAGARDEAIARFKRGLELYEEQDYATALIEFRHAYDLAPNYKVLYNIAQVCFQLTDYACALRSFESYLFDGGAEVPSKRRAEVEQEITRLRTRVAELEVTTDVDGAEIAIDDVPVGRAPLPKALTVSAGRRRVSAQKEGRVPVARVVDVAGSTTVHLRLELPRVAAASPSRPPEEPSRWVTLSWVGLATAGTLGAAGAVTGVAALDSQRQLDQMRFAGDEPSSQVRAAQSKTQALAVTTDVLLGAAALTLGATLVWTLTRSVKPEGARALRLLPRIGGCELHATF
jgi:hypothetical protein